MTFYRFSYVYGIMGPFSIELIEVMGNTARNIFLK